MYPHMLWAYSVFGTLGYKLLVEIFEVGVRHGKVKASSCVVKVTNMAGANQPRSSGQPKY